MIAVMGRVSWNSGPSDFRRHTNSPWLELVLDSCDGQGLMDSGPSDFRRHTNSPWLGLVLDSCDGQGLMDSGELRERNEKLAAVRC